MLLLLLLHADGDDDDGGGGDDDDDAAVAHVVLTPARGGLRVGWQGFYVETPCHSIARPGKIMAGTRITLLQKAPDGFDFTIRTPGTPPRWVEMDQEMGHVWRLLTMEARRKPAPDLDKFTELALSFYFYWSVRPMFLSRRLVC